MSSLHRPMLSQCPRLLRLSTLVVAAGLSFVSLCYGAFAPPADHTMQTAPPTSTICRIGEAQHNEPVSLKVGQSLEVSLEANPTTGFEWQVARTDNRRLPQVGGPVFEPPASGREGDATVQTLRFLAREAGMVELELHYRRPWEKEGEPLKTFVTFVEISG